MRVVKIFFQGQRDGEWLTTIKVEKLQAVK